MMIIIPSHGETKRPTDAQKMEVCFNAQCQCRILFTHTNSHTTACVQKNKPESIPRARHPDDTPTPTGPMERLMRDLRRLEDEIHASTSSPTRTGTTRRRSRSVTPTTGGSPARGARIGFLTNDDVADDGGGDGNASRARARGVGWENDCRPRGRQRDDDEEGGDDDDDDEENTTKRGR